MSEYPHLDRAPIAEAVIEIRVRHEIAPSLDSLRAVCETARDSYPTIQEQREFSGTIALKQDGTLNAEKNTDDATGYRCLSTDKQQIVSFKRDSFSFSRLKPYTTWSHVFDEAMKLWDQYQLRLSPVGVTRVATRFINRIELPSGRPISAFLKAPVPVPDGLPKIMGSLLTRVVVIDPETKLQATVIQQAQPALSRDSIEVLLDIDASKSPDIELDPARERALIVNIFAELHTLKNRVFFASVTDETLRMYR